MHDVRNNNLTWRFFCQSENLMSVEIASQTLLSMSITSWREVGGNAMSVSPLVLCCLIFPLKLASMKNLLHKHKREGICHASSIQRDLCWMLYYLVYISLPLNLDLSEVISELILESPNLSGREETLLAQDFLSKQMYNI